MKIGIIGGTKGLGKTLAWYFKEDNFDVTITGRDESFRFVPVSWKVYER